MIVAKITQKQADELKGKEFVQDNYFNPIEDANGNWIISIEEIENNVNPNFEWLQDLEMIIFVPKENTDLF
jgi:hypothetical protein